MMQELVLRDSGQKIGVASKHIIPFFSCGLSSYTFVGRIMFHSPSLGYDLSTADCTDLLYEETFVIKGQRLALSQVEILSQSDAVLIAEGLKLVPEWRPADRSPHLVPKSWLAL